MIVIPKDALDAEAKARGEKVRLAVIGEAGGMVQVDADCLAWRFPELVIIPAASAPRPSVSIPYDQWPLWAKAAGLMRAAGDCGVGDTVKRTIGDERSAAFSAFYRRVTGRDCGCAGRQAMWNIVYRYTFLDA